MLTLATLGMFSYGLYSLGWAVVDVVRGHRLEFWADGGLVIFGLVLALSAALVRVRLPGSLALAAGAMLGLQALAVHNASHLAGGLTPQVGRALLAVTLLGLAAGPKPGVSRARDNPPPGSEGL